MHTVEEKDRHHCRFYSSIQKALKMQKVVFLVCFKGPLRCFNFINKIANRFVRSLHIFRVLILFKFFSICVFPITCDMQTLQQPDVFIRLTYLFMKINTRNEFELKAKTKRKQKNGFPRNLDISSFNAASGYLDFVENNHNANHKHNNNN